MKYVIIIVVMVVVLILWMMKRPSPSTNIQNHGNLSATPRYLEALLKSQDSDSYVIITHAESGQFLQFTAGENTVQMDFPVFTKNQEEKSELVKETCSSLGLVLKVTRGSDGSMFYDWDLSGSSENMSKIITQVFGKSFGTKPEDDYIFEHDEYLTI